MGFRKISRPTRTLPPTRNSTTAIAPPLARAAGGTERCGAPVFASMDDPDYRAILDTFAPIATLLAQTPRMDMPGATPAPDVCRDTQ